MDLGHQGGCIHYGYDGLTGVGHFAGEQRPIRDDSVDGRANLRVAQSSLCSFIFPLRRLTRTFRVLMVAVWLTDLSESRCCSAMS